MMVNYASNGIMVFIPCNTVLVYVAHSMVQVRTKPPHTHARVCIYVCVCVCVCTHEQMFTHTYMNLDMWALPHT